MDAVTAGSGAHQQHDVVHFTGCGGCDVIGADQAYTHSVDQRVSGIGLVKANLTGDVGHANAVAIPRDATDHAVEKMPVLRVF